MLTALDIKLERLKLAIIFIIVELCWAEKQEPEDVKT